MREHLPDVYELLARIVADFQRVYGDWLPADARHSELGPDDFLADVAREAPAQRPGKS